ncbi:uncharacterized protein DS421_13g399170 [Arachis hypogaea]|nr:uncharacterized protein DS421_13g399170 [Arachis hypogaea]
MEQLNSMTSSSHDSNNKSQPTSTLTRHCFYLLGVVEHVGETDDGDDNDDEILSLHSLSSFLVVMRVRVFEWSNFLCGILWLRRWRKKEIEKGVVG